MATQTILQVIGGLVLTGIVSYMLKGAWAAGAEFLKSFKETTQELKTGLKTAETAIHALDKAQGAQAQETASAKERLAAIERKQERQEHDLRTTREMILVIKAQIPEE